MGTGDDFESTELSDHFFRSNGEERGSVTIDASEAGECKGEVHDVAEDGDTYRVQDGCEMGADGDFEDGDQAKYDRLVIQGGRPFEWIHHEDRSREIVEHVVETETPVAVPGHGPSLLARPGVLEQSLTRLPTEGTDIEQVEVEYQTESVVVGGNVVTCPLWAKSSPWVEKYLEFIT